MAITGTASTKRERKPGNATMASIAAHTGLSRATVTLVLHGRGDEQRIRPETQRRVLEAARELGYRANSSARALRDGRFGNIGLVQSYESVYLPIEMLRGLSDAVSARRLHLMFKEVQPTMMDEDPFLPAVVQELSADGLVINRIPDLSPHFVDLIREYHIPAVFLNVKEPYDSVHPDDLYAGRWMTEHLLRLGHEQITYVGTTPNANKHYSETDRRAGYEAAMQEAGRSPCIFMLPEYPGYVAEAINDRRIAAATRLLDHPDRPTAVVAYELAEALAVVHAAHALRLDLPADLSVIMCHHGPDHRFCIPITIFSNAMYPVGYAAVEMLEEKLADADLQVPSRAIRGEYIGGGTCTVPRIG